LPQAHTMKKMYYNEMERLNIVFFEELQFELTIFNPDGYIDYLVRLPNQLLDIQWQKPANFLQ
jgi:hypothetical protein